MYNLRNSGFSNLKDIKLQSLVPSVGPTNFSGYTDNINNIIMMENDITLYVPLPVQIIPTSVLILYKGPFGAQVFLSGLKLFY